MLGTAPTETKIVVVPLFTFSISIENFQNVLHIAHKLLTRVSEVKSKRVKIEIVRETNELILLPVENWLSVLHSTSNYYGPPH